MEGQTMTTPATASSLREATSPEALTRARRRLLTAHPDPTSANTPTPGSLTDEHLRVLAAHDWAPPRIAALDANTIATADAITRALLAESARESLERRLTTERPNGTYDDTRAGHDAFSRGVVEDYDHGNHHLARATICPADPGLVTRAALSALGLPDTDAPIIDELARASDPNPLARLLADAALLDLDRYATGRGLRYSRVGTTLMLAAPNEQRLADAIDTVAAAAINAGARVTDLTTQCIDDEKALASVGIDPWTAKPSDEPTGQADRILYVGRDGARVHVKAGRVLVDAPGSLPATSLPKTASRIVLSGNVGLSAGARSWAMRSGVDVVCLSRRGSYQGTLIGANGERTLVGSSRKWPSSVTMSGASA
ncbi:CRISPR associated protein Cas1-like protein [Actinomyces sp. ICM47]|nr:CRISPR associated protein Cas1-like protein [Actinomyces sp. ICM47]